VHINFDSPWESGLRVTALPKWGVALSFGWFMVFNATFNNISVISWRSVLLLEETGFEVPGNCLLERVKYTNDP